MHEKIGNLENKSAFWNCHLSEISIKFVNDLKLI